MQRMLQNDAILVNIHSKGVAGKSGDANKKNANQETGVQRISNTITY
jgi:hypothetical protein